MNDALHYSKAQHTFSLFPHNGTVEHNGDPAFLSYEETLDAQRVHFGFFCAMSSTL